MAGFFHSSKSADDIFKSADDKLLHNIKSALDIFNILFHQMQTIAILMSVLDETISVSGDLYLSYMAE